MHILGFRAQGLGFRFQNLARPGGKRKGASVGRKQGAGCAGCQGTRGVTRFRHCLVSDISVLVNVWLIEEDGLLYDDLERLDVLVNRHLETVFVLVHLSEHLHDDSHKSVSTQVSPPPPPPASSLPPLNFCAGLPQGARTPRHLGSSPGKLWRHGEIPALSAYE
jgi:hypothetical protein